MSTLSNNVNSPVSRRTQILESFHRPENMAVIRQVERRRFPIPISSHIKKPNLMNSLKKSTVVMGFSSWRQEAKRQRSKNNRNSRSRISEPSRIPDQTRIADYARLSDHNYTQPSSSQYHRPENSFRKKTSVLKSSTPNGSASGLLTSKPIKKTLAHSKHRQISSANGQPPKPNSSGSREAKKPRKPEVKTKVEARQKPVVIDLCETDETQESDDEDEENASSDSELENGRDEDEDYKEDEDQEESDDDEEEDDEEESEVDSDTSDDEVAAESYFDESHEKPVIDPETGVILFPYIESKNEYERGSSVYFCIFCDRTFTSFSLALHHLRIHLKFGYHCSTDDFHYDLTHTFIQHHIRKKHVDQPVGFRDDHLVRRNVNSWIIDFLNEQFTASRLEDKDTDIPKPTAWIQCPLCIKAAKFKKKFPIKYTSFQAFERHYWQHTRWWRVDCLLCGASIQRAHQRTHLSEHNIPVRELNIFEIYFLERSDERTAEMLEGIVEDINEQFYARYKWYRNLRRELTVSLVPCDSDLDYYLSKIRPQPPNKRLNSRPENVDPIYHDETDEAFRRAMKILGGGTTPERDYSSVENEPPGR